MLPYGGVVVRLDRTAHGTHQPVHETDVVDCQKLPGIGLARLNQVMHVGARNCGAGGAIAFGIDRPIIGAEPRVLQVDELAPVLRLAKARPDIGVAAFRGAIAMATTASISAASPPRQPPTA